MTVSVSDPVDNGLVNSLARPGGKMTGIADFGEELISKLLELLKEALMSHGPDAADLTRKVVTYVAKILNGAKPADLPIDRPTKFELIAFLQTAKAIGLTIPQSLLLLADEVIQWRANGSCRRPS